MFFLCFFCCYFNPVMVVNFSLELHDGESTIRQNDEYSSVALRELAPDCCCLRSGPSCSCYYLNTIL